MTLEDELKKTYLNTQYKDFSFYDFSALLTKLFKKIKYSINKIYSEEECFYVDILEKNKSLNLLKIEFIKEDDLVTDIKLEINVNYLIITNNKNLINFLTK